MVHNPTGACFHYDDGGNLTLLNQQVLDQQMVAPDKIQLITQGAQEALRRERERDPTIQHTWLP